MKKTILFLLSTFLVFGLTACGDDSAKSSQKQPAVESSEVQNTKDSASKEETDLDSMFNLKEEEEESTEEASSSGVDLDLTSLSATLVYSEVFNMMMAPDDYIGTTVKMEGICNMYQDPDTGKKYYACIVQDATQCCSQGLEFVLDEEKYSEEDYPETGEEITITGTFQTYEENGNNYLTMVDTVID
ncbi:MAG: hypothetical protein K6E79_08690 [Pseudobutyrivibrio sp.]|nr:hypothetical protein [Pseudobutyrivibrio sp.]